MCVVQCDDRGYKVDEADRVVELKVDVLTYSHLSQFYSVERNSDGLTFKTSYFSQTVHIGRCQFHPFVVGRRRGKVARMVDLTGSSRQAVFAHVMSFHVMVVVK